MWFLQKLKLLNSRCQFLWHDYCSWSAYNNSHNLCKNWSCWVQDVNFCNIIVITWQTYNNLCHLCKNWSCWTQDVNFCNKIIVHDQHIIIHMISLTKHILLIIWLSNLLILQKLTSWVQWLQFLQRSYELLYEQ